MSQGIATIGCYHSCPAYDGDTPHTGGPVLMGSPNLFVEGKNVCRVGDFLQCNSSRSDTALSGSAYVFINGLSVCRKGDPTVHGGVITEGSNSVFIG